MFKKIELPENFFSFDLSSITGTTEKEKLSRFSFILFGFFVLYPPAYQFLNGVDTEIIIWRELYIFSVLLAPTLISFYLVNRSQERRERVLNIIDWTETTYSKSDNPNLRKFAADTVLQARKAADNYKPGKYLLPLFLLPIISAIGFFSIFSGANEIFYSEKFSSLFSTPSHTMQYGFVGAYLFVLYSISNRCKSMEITPEFILRMCLQLLLAPIAAFLFAPLVSEIWTYAVAFIIGFIPYHQVATALYDNAYSRIKKKNDIVVGEGMLRSRSLESLAYLKGMSKSDYNCLQEQGIYTIHNLAVANPLSLYLFTSLSISQIVDWINQAYLRTFVDAESFERLSPLGIHGVISLYNKRGQIRGNTPISKHLRHSIAKALNKDGEEIVVVSLIDQICSDPRVMFLDKLWSEKGGE